MSKAKARTSFAPMDKTQCPANGDKLIVLAAHENRCYTTGHKFECVYFPAGRVCPDTFNCTGVIFVRQIDYVTKRLEG